MTKLEKRILKTLSFGYRSVNSTKLLNHIFWDLFDTICTTYLKMLSEQILCRMYNVTKSEEFTIPIPDIIVKADYKLMVDLIELHRNPKYFDSMPESDIKNAINARLMINKLLD